MAQPLFASLPATDPATRPSTQSAALIIAPIPLTEIQRAADQSIAAAWAHLDDSKLITQAISNAQSALSERSKVQPAQWWEVVRAQVILDELKHVLKMSPADRTKLTAALSACDALSSSDARKDANAVQAVRVAAEDLHALLGNDDDEIANRLNEIYGSLYPEVWPVDLLRDAVRIQKIYYKGDSPYVACSLQCLACTLALADKTKSAEALELARQASQMYRRLTPSLDDPELIDSLRVLAICQAVNHLPIDAFDILTDQQRVASLFNQIGDQFRELRRFDEAVKMYELGMAVNRKTGHLDGRMVVSDLIRIGDCFQNSRQLDRAVKSYRDALEAAKESGSGDSAFMSDALDVVAKKLQTCGYLGEALIDFQNEIAIRQAAGTNAPADPGLATAFNNLGVCQQALGLNDDAKKSFDRALELGEAAFPKSDYHLIDIYNDIAYWQRMTNGQSGAQIALPLFKRVLRLYMNVKPARPDRVATALINVAYCEQVLGHFENALNNFRSALNIDEQLGDSQEEIALAQYDFAECLRAAGQPSQAIPYFQRALTIRHELFPDGHPDVAATWAGLGSAQAAAGMWDQADHSLLEAEKQKWSYLTGTFPILSDAQKADYLTHARFGEAQRLVDIATQPKRASPATADAAMNAVLLDKYLLFEVARQEQGALLAAQSQASPQWRALWNERQQERRNYTLLAMQLTHPPPAAPGAPSSESDGEDVRGELEKSSEHLEELEQLLRRGNPAYARQAQVAPIDLDNIFSALHPGQVLVEYFRFCPFDAKAKNSDALHYAAFVIKDNNVSVIDLGDSAEIDQAVQDYRTLVNKCIGSFPSHKDLRNIVGASMDLYSKVLAPLRASLGDAQRLYVAPDGWLALFPFEALVTNSPPGDSPDQAHYLIEDEEIIYLTTGRDLARLSAPARTSPAIKSAVLVGNPNFDASARTLASILAGQKPTQSPEGSAPTTSPDGSATRQIANVYWKQYPSLRDLVFDAARQLRAFGGWKVTILTDSQATEEAVEALHAPTILQFATHGYMLGSEENGWQDAFNSAAGRPGDAVPRQWINPLLQSMLVMAGENQWPGRENASFYPLDGLMLPRQQALQRGISAEQFARHAIRVGDGCLTAYEVSGMDLHGTQFVNLTACQTGLGTISPQGVAGLRQGFMLAGARSLTMSMWEIPADLAPQEAENFYNGWLGERIPRYKAFRRAQLELLDGKQPEYPGGPMIERRSRPDLWAGVVYVGDPDDQNNSLSSTVGPTTNQ